MQGPEMGTIGASRGDAKAPNDLCNACQFIPLTQLLHIHNYATHVAPIEECVVRARPLSLCFGTELQLDYLSAHHWSAGDGSPHP